MRKKYWHTMFPKGGVMLSAKTPKALIDQLDNIAKQRHISRSAVIRQALIEWIDRNKEGND